MPRAVPTLRLAHQRARIEQRRGYDQARAERHEYRAWYKTGRWAAIRAHQLRIEPLCRMCREGDDERLTPATVCDHVEPHNGDRERFFAGPFQSLCKSCHDGAKQRAEVQKRRGGGTQISGDPRPGPAL